MTLPPTPATDDAFLGDALHILQPKGGYRAGVDAVLLAATVAEASAARMLDAGSGVGVVGLCVARRNPHAHVTLLEREPEAARLARLNVARNDLADRVAVIEADVTSRADHLRTLGLADESFDIVLANPPFHATGHGTPASHALKETSHAMAADALEAWVRFAVRMTRPGGTFTLIHKADALPAVLAAFAQRFGAVKVKPIYARPGQPAIRILVRGTKGSRAPLELCAPLVLHADGHGFTPELDAILRHSAALPL